jgi:hypothetical protein
MDAIAWGLPVLVFLLICPLMMLGMGLMAWVAVRFLGRTAGQNGHGSHAMCGPMMMMGHGSHGEAGHQHDQDEISDLMAELKAQRERLDQLIARAEQQATQAADAAEGGLTGT